MGVTPEEMSLIGPKASQVWYGMEPTAVAPSPRPEDYDDTPLARTLKYQEGMRKANRRRAAEEYLLLEAVASVPDPRSTVQLWEWTNTQEAPQ